MQIPSTSLRLVVTAAALLLAAACGPDERVPGPAPYPAPTPGVPPEEAEIPAQPDETAEAAIHISPTTGTTATSVTIHGQGFPPDSRVDLGFGLPQSEYRIFGAVETDDDGEFSTVVTPPEWAEPGRDYVFVAAGVAGDRAVSQPFRVRSGDDAPSAIVPQSTDGMP